MAKLTKPVIAVNIDGTVRVLNQDPNATHFNWYTRELLSYNITSPGYDTIVAGTNESTTALPNSSYTNRVYITESYRDIRKFTSFTLYEAGSSSVDVTELYVTKISDFEYSISIPNVEHDYIITWGVGTVEQPPTDCILFKGETSDFTLKATNKTWNGTVEYSTDKNTWSTWDGSEISSADKKLYLRGKNNTTFYTTKAVQFVLSAKAGCYGNINTLLDYENPPTALASSCYREMFYGCTLLTTAPELPATTLAYTCYSSMFYGCRSLTVAPALPATTLAESCYYNMFSSCKSLTTAPELPAEILADFCYYSMFQGCTSLTTAPSILPATTLTIQCYQFMFSGCRSLTTAPALPATTLTLKCYRGMFSGCTSLTTAPALPATTLAESCYRAMFDACKSLTTAPELPATTLASSCYNSMFYGCTGLKISATQTGEYTTAWRIPSNGEIAAEATDWNTDMLANTGGTFKENPSINTTYYGAW